MTQHRFISHRPIAPLAAIVFAATATSTLAAIAQDSNSNNESATEVEIPEPPKWNRSLDFGLSGSTGNTVEQDINLAFSAHKITPKSTYDFVATYRLSTDDGEETDNRLYLTGRRTWLFTDSKWGIFTQSSADIDRFKAWDQRFTGHAGLSYRIIDDTKTFFEGRAGIGGVWTIGSEFDDKIDPEGIIGATLRHQFTEKLSFLANAEYLPNLNDTGEYRFLGNAEIKYSLSESWSLKAGIEEVFDSDPDAGDEESDFYYTFKLAWNF